MGKLVTLGSVLTVLATLFALAPKFAMPGQIVVAALSTTFIAVAFWKTNFGFGAEDVTIGYQLQQDVLCPAPPPL